MKTKKSFLPLRLAAATVLTLLFVFSLATNATDASVDISSKDVSTIQSDIQAAINNVENGGGGTITVTGSKTGVGSMLTLDILEGVKVLWQATYSDNGSLKGDILISLSGIGIFEVGTGGSISVSTANRNAIHSASQINVTVSGTGKVHTDVGYTIYTFGSVLVTGGEVSTTSGAAVGASGDTATITVSGGSVSATTGSAIAASSNSTVTVTGGSVSATTGNAITAYGASSTVTVSGGLVFAYGSDIIGDGNVVYVRDNPSGFTDASGTGVVIAWNQGASNTHASGSETDITLAPDTGAAVWATREGQNGIAYTNGDNEGFIPLSDVTVKPALTGTVTITGTPAYGKTLTAVTGGLTVEPGNSGVTDLGDLSYQWKRSDTEISDATEQTYTLVSEDVGKTITATVTAENCLESVTSAPTTVLDLSALEAKLAEAKAIKRGNYITSTWDALQEAIAGAETTLETEAQHVTQEAIDAALDALISAIDGLRHIYLLPPDSNNNDENDDAVEPPEPSEEPEENPFDDVGQNDWFYEDVMFAYRRGLMTGTSARKFSPDAPMARGMIVTVLHRMESEPAARGATTFSDVADGKYYTEAVAWAEAEGIVDGYGNGLFGPEEDITRQDLALLFLRYARYKGLTLPAIRQYTAFIDDADVSDYAREAARTLYRAGIISGKPGSRLDPKGTATRAEVAAMLLRFLESVQQ